MDNIQWIDIVLIRAVLNRLVAVRVTHCANECRTSQRVSDPDRNGENFDKSVRVGKKERRKLRRRWEKSINNEREVLSLKWVRFDFLTGLTWPGQGAISGDPWAPSLCPLPTPGELSVCIETRVHSWHVPRDDDNWAGGSRFWVCVYLQHSRVAFFSVADDSMVQVLVDSTT